MPVLWNDATPPPYSPQPRYRGRTRALYASERGSETGATKIDQKSKQPRKHTNKQLRNQANKETEETKKQTQKANNQTTKQLNTQTNKQTNCWLHSTTHWDYAGQWAVLFDQQHIYFRVRCISPCCIDLRGAPLVTYYCSI